jgi:chromosome transmission fidelity protein 4
MARGHEVMLSSERDVQKTFQSGSTAAVGNRRYLAFNMIGTICSVDSSTHFTVDVAFHDTSQRAFHFTDHHQYNLAALGTVGAVFASESTTTLPSVIHYRPLDSWASKNDWTMELASGESAIGT